MNAVLSLLTNALDVERQYVVLNVVKRWYDNKQIKGYKMRHRITQRIYTCDICGETPDDGEYLWHMNNEVWCEKCCCAEDEDESIIFPASG